MKKFYKKRYKNKMFQKQKNSETLGYNDYNVYSMNIYASYENFIYKLSNIIDNQACYTLQTKHDGNTQNNSMYILKENKIDQCISTEVFLGYC